MQRVQRECSVRLEVKREVGVFDLLKRVGVKPENHLTAVQSLPGGRQFDVTFKTVAVRREFQNLLEREQDVTITSYGDDTKIITILHVPFEADDNTVRYVLSRFGKVVDGRMLTYREFPKIFNGIRQYKMKLEKDIPSSLNLAGRDCWVRYDGQPRTCLKCQKSGHEAKECTVTRCFRCGGEGHFAQECKEAIKCSICGESGHGFRACPISFAAKLKVTSSWTKGTVAGDAEKGEGKSRDAAAASTPDDEGLGGEARKEGASEASVGAPTVKPKETAKSTNEGDCSQAPASSKEGSSNSNKTPKASDNRPEKQLELESLTQETANGSGAASSAKGAKGGSTEAKEDSDGTGKGTSSCADRNVESLEDGLTPGQKSLFDGTGSEDDDVDMDTHDSRLSWADQTADEEGKRNPRYLSPSPLFGEESEFREVKYRRHGRRGTKRQSTSLSPRRK